MTAALVGLHALLFGVVLNRWIARPVLRRVLLVATASAAYFASTYAVYLDPSMVRNVIRTDTQEARELLTWTCWDRPADGRAARPPRCGWYFPGVDQASVVAAHVVLGRDVADCLRRGDGDLPGSVIADAHDKALRYLIALAIAIVSISAYSARGSQELKGPRQQLPMPSNRCMRHRPNPPAGGQSEPCAQN